MPELNFDDITRECIIQNSSDIIITENGEAVLYKVSDNSKFMTSNIFAARITEYVPQLHAYFTDIGDSRRALLNTQAHYSTGDFVLVQMITAAHGKKGARVTADIRLNSVYIVLLPTQLQQLINISAKITNSAERERLLMVGESLNSDCSMILRTQASFAAAGEIAADYQSLKTLWHDILRQYEDTVRCGTPRLLYGQNPLYAEILKYPLGSYDSFYVDSPEFAESLSCAFPAVSGKIHCIPHRIFAVKSVDSVQSTLLCRKVYLKSGADIVIDKTEAMTVIDVNSGKSSLSYRNVNLEAAREIMRQLRLRDIGGIIICDFIEMKDKADREHLLSFMRELALLDPSKPEIPGLTALGLVEIARKRS